MNIPAEKPSTFGSIFFPEGRTISVRVPDYQRAYSWDWKQIELFIGDLIKYQGSGKGYYFGHFIAEKVGGDTEERWEIVDGQQRITTFVLFLMACRSLSPSGHSAYSMIQRFSTVSYDAKSLESMGDGSRMSNFLDANKNFGPKNPPSDKDVIEGLGLSEDEFTSSQRRMAFALLHFRHAFLDGKLKESEIEGYIGVIMNAHCSRDLAPDKSVAVNIFEMHNTRGVPLTTVEIIKATLMKYVYDHPGGDSDSEVKKIQTEFGEIYRMEERLAAGSFRGEITMDQLLRLHLRVVDDGTKKKASEFDSPALNANADALVAYVDGKLGELGPAGGVKYARDLAREFKKSVWIVSETLPGWDKKDPLVGDVMILDRDPSCQFFLIICRRLEEAADQANGRLGSGSLLLWERLLFTRDFHDEYHGLWYRDNFPALYESCGLNEAQIAETLRCYLENGFRPERTKGLQSIVAAFLEKNKERVLNGAFDWRGPKMTYTIYKYEVSNRANIRDVMKGYSMEHILPQEWKWEWVEAEDVPPKKLSKAEQEGVQRKIGSYINGIGNLLLLTPGENASQGNRHPATKDYGNKKGGSYEEHGENREKWRSSANWENLIQERGNKIYDFMLKYFLDAPASSSGAEAGDGNA